MRPSRKLAEDITQGILDLLIIPDHLLHLRHKNCSPQMSGAFYLFSRAAYSPGAGFSMLAFAPALRYTDSIILLPM